MPSLILENTVVCPLSFQNGPKKSGKIKELFLYLSKIGTIKGWKDKGHTTVFISDPLFELFDILCTDKNQLEVLQLAAQLEVFVTTSVFGFLFAVSED